MSIEFTVGNYLSFKEKVTFSMEAISEIASSDLDAKTELNNNYEVTDLYSLVEFSNVPEEAAFESDYIKGKYGAIPYIGNLKDLI
jgi:hypothetical protein